MENNFKAHIESLNKGLAGLLGEVGNKLAEAKNLAQTDEQKKEFQKTFVESGLLNNFADIKKQFQDLNK